MKTNYSPEEARQVFDIAKNEFNLVRLVNPLDRHVHTLDTQDFTPEICHSVWGRCERCENCTSLRALTLKRNTYKIEFLDENVFLVMSKYMEIDHKPFILELVSNITDDFLADTNQKDRIAEVIQQHNHLIVTDALTGLYNRRFLDQYFIPSLQCCYDEGTTVNLAVLDIDRFKVVNDTYGHLAGDKMLQDVSGFWKLHFNTRHKNKEQLTIRYGGDEMLIISCGHPYDEFKRKLHSYYANMRKVCYIGNDVQIPFNLSFGTASTEEFPPSSPWAWPSLFSIADKRLYEEKAHHKKNLYTI